MSEVQALRLFRWCFAAFIAVASVETYTNAHHDLHATVLSSVEFVAIIAFLVEPLERVACAILLLVFAAAAVLTAIKGEIPVRFIYFSATALYIVHANRGLTLRPSPV